MIEGYRVGRRIVTGNDPDGIGVFARVDELTPAAGTSLPIDGYRVWGSDSMPLPLPTDGLRPVVDGDHGQDVDALIAGMHPEGPQNGFRMGVYVFAPHTGASEVIGIHHHDTVDLIFILDGEMTLNLPTSKMVLRAGDSLVLNGTSHCFDNESDAPAAIGLVSMGGQRVGPHNRAQALQWDAELGYHYGQGAL
jgi:quercetin dioxygenase-like cupin family protein